MFSSIDVLYRTHVLLSNNEAMPVERFNNVAVELQSGCRKKMAVEKPATYRTYRVKVRRFRAVKRLFLIRLIFGSPWKNFRRITEDWVQMSDSFFV